MKVILRAQFFGKPDRGLLGRPAFRERGGGALAEDRPRADAEPGETHPGGTGEKREPDQRIIALPSREFAKHHARARRGEGDLDRGEHLVGRQRGREQAVEECARRNAARLAGALQHHLGLQREHAGRQFGGRIGMSEAAADRAAIADGGVADLGCRGAEQRQLRSDLGGREQVNVAGQCANGETFGIAGDAAKRRETGNVDQEIRGEQPEIERRDKALATGQKPCRPAMPGEEAQRFGLRGGSRIIERRRLHEILSFPPGKRTCALASSAPTFYTVGACRAKPGRKTMPVDSLDHYSIRTTDLAATTRFYTEVMGFENGARPDFPFPGVWLYRDGHALVHVIGIDPNDPEGLAQYLGARGGEGRQDSGVIDHIAFVASDLAALRGRLQTQYVAFRERTVPTLGLHQVFIEDPNGITIELNFAAAEVPLAA